MQQRLVDFLVKLMLIIFVALSMTNTIIAQSGWERDKTVGLPAGTCIREGPGLTYRAHTRVPENNWTVMVIDGPRTVDGRTWYDTSRKAAGDPSGGTGWVAADTSDTDCSYIAPNNPNPQTDIPQRVIQPVNATLSNLPGWLAQIRNAWLSQTPTAQWVIALIGLMLLIVLWRQISWGFTMLMQLLIATLFAVILWWVFDQTRQAWQVAWVALAGANAPDLALLIGAIPYVSWLVSTLRRFVRRKG